MNESRWIVPYQQKGHSLTLWKIGPFALADIGTAIVVLGELPLRQRPDAAWVFRGEPDINHIYSLVSSGRAIGDAPGAETHVVFPRPDRTAS